MNKLNTKISGGIVMLLSCFLAEAQTEIDEQTGTVSYVTSSRVYVKFDNTGSIIPGDTLYIFELGALEPVLVVDQKSTLSVVGKLINDRELVKGDQVQFFGELLIKKDYQAPDPKVPDSKDDKLKGSVSLATYSSASSATNFDIRNVGRIRLKADEINDSNFSFDTYLIYRQNLESSESGLYKSPGLFNVYGLSITHKKENSHSISIGRKINRRVASLGMVDGLHVEKQLGPIHVGAIGGFRPDSQSNAFNTSVSQYGGYLGISHISGQKRLETTIGLLEQKNGSAIDRQYMYFQGSASLGNGLNIFSSAEMDLYTLDTAFQKTGTRLTNFHLSTHFRVTKRVRLSMSYDTRRNIIFYETFQTRLEQLIADDQARQGIRARVNFRLNKRITGGFAYGKRYQNNLNNASDNFNAFARLRNTPIIGGTLSGNINVNQSSYLNSISTTLRHNRPYFNNKVNASSYLRSVVYTYNPERETAIVHQFLGSSVNYNFANKLTLRGLVEFSLRKGEYKNRLNLQLTKRF